MDRQDHAGAGRGTPAGRPGERLYKVVGFSAAAVACLVGLYFFLRVPPPGGNAQDGGRVAEGSPVFPGWGKPDVALVLSGQQHGYLQPCGCTDPQYGGLARRYNFIQSLRDRGWPVVCLDVGDVAEPPKRAQRDQPLLKYATSMKSLRAMDYLAVGFGKNELNMPLTEAMAAYSLNHATPRVLGTNLATREKKGDPFHDTIVPWEIGGKDGTPKVGAIGLVGPSVESEVKGKDDDVRFYQDTPKVIDRALAELQSRKAELVVVLYQGLPREAEACAAYCARRHREDPRYPQVHVILSLCETDEPPALPILVGETMIVRVGHKGRYVGVVGAYRGRGGRPWEMKYQLVSISKQFETEAGREAQNPIIGIMEEYTAELKAGGYLKKVRQKKHPIQVMFDKLEPDYRGSASCRGCHPDAYKVWKDSGHAHAYETLEKAKRPKYRQYDPECIVCHTVGFGYEGGFVHEETTPKFKDVGCESCHGPCGAHVDNPRDMDMRKAINPYRFDPKESAAQRQFRINKLELFCQSCHDTDNDAKWHIRKWDKIIHHTPREKK